MQAVQQVESDEIILTSGRKVKRNDENLKPISLSSGHEAEKNRGLFVCLCSGMNCLLLMNIFVCSLLRGNEERIADELPRSLLLRI